MVFSKDEKPCPEAKERIKRTLLGHCPKARLPRSSETTHQIEPNKQKVFYHKQYLKGVPTVNL